MKLRTIAEAGIKGRTVVRNTGQSLGELISFIRNSGDREQQKAMASFLKNPTPESWEQSKWLIDAAIKIAANDKNNNDYIKSWSALKGLSSPVAVASLYDMEPKHAKGTPIQSVVLSKPGRDKFKAAIGPQGYIGTMANAGELGDDKLRKLIKTTAKNGAALTKAAKKDIPSVKPVSKF